MWWAINKMQFLSKSPKETQKSAEVLAKEIVRKASQKRTAFVLGLEGELVAIGLIGAFVYFRNKAKTAVEEIADTTTKAVDKSTQDAEKGLGTFEDSGGKSSGGGDSK